MRKLSVGTYYSRSRFNFRTMPDVVEAYFETCGTQKYPIWKIREKMDHEGMSSWTPEVPGANFSRLLGFS